MPSVGGLAQGGGSEFSAKTNEASGQPGLDEGERSGGESYLGGHMIRLHRPGGSPKRLADKTRRHNSSRDFPGVRRSVACFRRNADSAVGPVPVVLVAVFQGFQELIAYFLGVRAGVPLPQVKELRACEDHGVEAWGACEPWGRPVPGYEVHDG